MTDFRNRRRAAVSGAELSHFRREKWALYHDEVHTETRPVLGNPVVLRKGLTFTPFANAVACNAHCAFCSEELVRDSAHSLTAKRLIQNYDLYFDALEAALRSLSGFTMGLSLSGLEATAEPRWLLRLLALMKKLKPVVRFDEKVLYTNGTGLLNFPELIPALAEGFNDAGIAAPDGTSPGRIELSRCHFDETVNQDIMRFGKGEAIQENVQYAALLSRLSGKLTVKNSCILTKRGIATIENIERYAAFAAALGIQTIVFRELSRLDGSYQASRFTEWIESNRIPIEPLLEDAAPTRTEPRTGWHYLFSTFGYYYYNEHYRYGDVEVIFETSSYPALQAANQTGVIQKLVFHSNGNLCGDWDADEKVIGNFSPVFFAKPKTVLK